MNTSNSNVDPAELAKFSDLAHRWWDPESEFRPLHQINPLRLDWIQGMVPLQGQRALDVGCGGGILSDAMARQGAIDDIHAITLLGRSAAMLPSIKVMMRSHPASAPPPRNRYSLRMRRLMLRAA